MSTDTANEFELWIRRSQTDPQRFDIRFEVSEGKGILRTPSVSGAASTPASNRGHSTSIRATDLANSQFFRLTGSPSSRAGHARFEYRFKPSTLVDLQNLQGDHWFHIEADANMQLCIIGPSREASDTPDHRIAVATPSQNQTEADQNFTATRDKTRERDLDRARRHINQLKKRIVDLEAQVEELGGHVPPVILDYNA